MPKIASRSYTLEIEDKIKNRTIAIEPHTEIQFDITMAMYTQLSIGWIRIYNPDDYLKDFLMYKYPVGDKRNRLFITLKLMMLGTTDAIYSIGVGSNSYNYCGNVKAYVIQTALVHPNAKEEYIQLQLLSGLYNLFSDIVITDKGATVNATIDQVLKLLADYGYPVNYTGSLNRDTTKYGDMNSLKRMLDKVLSRDGSFSYIENDVFKIVNPSVGEGKGSIGKYGTYNNPFEINIDTGLMSYPQQINDNVEFYYTLDHQFPLDSYVRIPKELINRQLVTPSVNAGSAGLNWPLGSGDKYRILSYQWIGDYRDPHTWYQKVIAQAGNMPLSANLQFGKQSVGNL